MFLTAVYILGPVARVSVLIVQQTTDAKLFCCSAIPAGPVSGARGLMAEDSV